MRVCDFVVSLYVEEMASGSLSTIRCLFKIVREVRQIREENCEISKREGKLLKTKRPRSVISSIMQWLKQNTAQPYFIFALDIYLLA